MQIQAFCSGPLQTNAYLFTDATGACALIDAPPECSPAVIEGLAGRHPEFIWLTHSHWDHIAGIAEVLALLNSPAPPIFVHPLDAGNIRNPGSDKIPLSIPIAGIEPDRLYEDGRALCIGDCAFHAIHTPGHSPGSVCVYSEEQGLLFSGDTLFRGKPGTTALPTSDPALMAQSLKLLADLPPQTRIFPGHGPATTLRAELGWMRAYISAHNPHSAP